MLGRISASTGPVRPLKTIGAVENGILLHLDAGLPSSYPGSGATWYDLSGRGNNATLYNTPTYSSSDGGILTFSRSSSQYGDTADLGSQTNWSVECWAKLNTNLNNGVNAFVTNVYNGSNLNFSIGSNEPGSNTLRAGFFNGSWRNTTGYGLSTSIWYHMVGTYNGSTVLLYVNNVQQGSLSYSGTPSSGGGVRIARRWDSDNSSSNFVDGSIAIVRIYNRALSTTEINQNYTFQKSRFGY